MTEKITSAEYRALAELRYRIRQFLREGDKAAYAQGLEPQQYQLLLAIRGMNDGELATIGTLAERLAIKHHSAVELIDRLEKRGYIRRVRDKDDRRQVHVLLFGRGEKALAAVVEERISELRASGSKLVGAIRSLLKRNRSHGIRPRR
jgi:DNA-binding MarR family transcriptional regulator